MNLSKVKNVFESMIRDEEHHRESWLQRETSLVKSQRNRITRQKSNIKIQTLGARAHPLPPATYERALLKSTENFNMQAWPKR
jgi:hypothetical protein